MDRGDPFAPPLPSSVLVTMRGTRMHPNAYLRTLWRNETLDEVFVAMSFDERYKRRFNEVLRPAIEDQPIAGFQLRAFRVDNSNTGDSILTEIVDHISHCRIVLGDVSAIDEGRYTDVPIRNGNVMYEIGVALACRLPSEVLLIRDDDKKFLFDVSSVPNRTIDFKDSGKAIELIRSAIHDRIAETNLTSDARIRLAVRTLTQDEHRVLKEFAELAPDEVRDIAMNVAGRGLLSNPNARGVEGLLQKGCLRTVGINVPQGSMFYATTPFGYALAKAAEAELFSIDPRAAAAGADPDSKRT